MTQELVTCNCGEDVFIMEARVATVIEDEFVIESRVFDPTPKSAWVIGTATRVSHDETTGGVRSQEVERMEKRDVYAEHECAA